MTIREALHRAVGRNLLDGHAYNFGSRLVAIPEGAWSGKTRHEAWKLLTAIWDRAIEAGIPLDEMHAPAEPPPRRPASPAVIVPPREASTRTERVLEFEDGYFWLNFGYEPQIIEEIKAMPYDARAWMKGPKKWRIRLRSGDWVDNAAGRALMAITKRWRFQVTREAQQEIDILRVEAQRQIDAEKAAAASSHATVAEVKIKGLVGTPYPFQAAGIIYARARKRTFIADEMGLGKTIQAIGVIKAEQAFPALVVCPASLRQNWLRELQKWIPDDYATLDPYEIQKYRLPKVCVVSYAQLRKYEEPLQEIDWKAVVCDESHYLKNAKSGRAKNMKDLMKCAKPPFRLMLTGTPIENRPKEFLHQLVLLDRIEELGGEWYFLNRYCEDPIKGGYNGAQNTVELNKRIRRTCYIRRKKKDVLADLPPKTRTVVPIEISNRKEYNEARQDLTKYLKSKVANDPAIVGDAEDLFERQEAIDDAMDDLDAKSENSLALRKIAALKHLAGEGLIRDAVAWIKDFIENGEKLVVFAHHKVVQKAVAEALGDIAVWTRTSKGAQWAVDRFQNDPRTMVIVCSLKGDSAGHTLTAASNVAKLELGWTPSIHDQAEDRAHRIGQKDSVNVWYLIPRDTIYEEIYALIEAKRAIVASATDGEEPPEEYKRSVASELIRNMKRKAS